MRFFRRNQYLLLSFAVLVLACVMAMRQFLANETAHIRKREDFILLAERGDTKSCGQFYQVLIGDLRDLSDRLLVDDLQRTALLVNTVTNSPENPIWKYHVSVKRELQQRGDKRLEAMGISEQ